MTKIVNKCCAKNCLADMSGLELDMSSLDRIYPEKGGICSAHREIFFSTLILELRGAKLDKTWTQGSPQHKKQVPKEVFSKSKDFPSDFE
jgi:hypothetical protein